MVSKRLRIKNRILKRTYGVLVLRNNNCCVRIKSDKILLLTKQSPQLLTEGFGKSRRRPIFPGRCQPGIVGTRELNCCVRNGNRCGLSVIFTGNG